MFDCITFYVQYDYFVLTFEWPQTLQALWAFYEVAFVHCDIFGNLVFACNSLCCTCYEHVC